MSNGIGIWLEEFFKFVEIAVTKQELESFENYSRHNATIMGQTLKGSMRRLVRCTLLLTNTLKTKGICTLRDDYSCALFSRRDFV